ncbi:MAG: right-handed parallel beta-helix repeat-containing protein [Methanobrevibacter sp.]|uniref:right-handed parallel beta-helix repeat-containing protein n=1 Tax=Methanobrevibacter sp. TaxID=66852 RepID=UPI0025F18ED6|nr:right-handed parallel beta-helix repeat-containing protein [Methanobrevibacter sp.]MBQ6099527.1 right-handed parallel beta-helix repeat-containing protein [Methanobrevibacter sp.]
MIGIVLVCFIVSVSSVSAIDLDSSDLSKNITDHSNVISINEIAYSDDEIPDEPDLILNDTIYIDSDNFDDYFTDNTLKSKFSDKTLIFNQDFKNLGKLCINANNVTIKGIGYNLKNTVFQIEADHVTLKDIKMDLDSEYADNDGAGIEVLSDYVSLINVSINYIVPKNVEAYGIYAIGYPDNPLRNLKILNSYINFEGHNDDVNVYNCALKVVDCDDALIKNNTIISALPLKDIVFGINGAELASDLVLTVGIEGCNNISFMENSLFSQVNKRPENLYPSLDCMLISKSDGALICNNSIFMTDFMTYPGTDNYLYGLDIYNLNNLTACHNNIRIITTGGKMAAGTAYPIQITGPISNVNITENDLYSFSNGPNIGVYSQNFYGETLLSITNNKINVTGLAGTHEWALVAGIESQDTHSTIRNNTIEVHSVGDVSIDDNIYGVSYRQKTNGDHQFDIQNNTVISDGFYAVNVLSSVDSKILNNLLISYNSKAQTGNSGLKYWDINSHENLEFYNNQVIRAYEYFAAHNDVDNGDKNDYSTPKNNKDISNEIDGSKLSSSEEESRYSFNPLIPGSSKQNGVPDDGDQQSNNNQKDDSQNQGNSPAGSTNGDSSKEGMSLKDYLINFINSNTEGGSVNTTSYNGKNVNEVSNNTDATPSTEGESSAASQSKSSQGLDSGLAGDSDSVSKKVFEIEQKDKDGFIPSIFFIIPVMILFFIGVKRRKSKFE